MKVYLLCALTVCLLGLSSAYPQASHASFAAGSSTTIPIDVDNNIIRMKVRINGSRPLTMIFDTGASMTIIDDKISSELGLKTVGTMKGSGTGGNFTGKAVEATTLSVDGADVPVKMLASQAMPMPPGFEFDGVLGYDFIAPFVVEVDYDKKTMTLRDPRSYVYRGKGTIVPLDLRNRKTPLIRTIMGLRGRAPFAVSLELDTGFDGSFTIYHPIVVRQSLLRYFKHGAESTAHGAGGEQQRMWVTFDSAMFGPVRIAKPAVALSFQTQGSDSDPTSQGVIGGEILRRFRMIIDYSRSRMILEKNSHFNEPFDIDDSE